jgi:hypothetical protein
MPNIPFFAAGELGLIKDIPPDELDPRAWSDARNVRFSDGKIFSRNGHSQVFETLSGTPYWLLPIQAGTAAIWIYASLIKLYATDGATHVDITRAVGGDYTMDKFRKWIGGTLSNIPIITDGLDVPQMWLSPSMATKFADLSAWPVGDVCKAIKPFKSFLVALNITRGGTNYGHLVKWSHPSVPGSVPTTWDETDPTKLAGEVELVDELPGAIRTGLGLRDTFIIYKDNSTWGMQYIGGNSVFRFFPIFLQAGIMSHHCVSNIMNGSAHFVATGDDFILHDGQNAKSVFDRRMTSNILRMLPSTAGEGCFTVANPQMKEVWFCFSQSENVFPDIAAIYNWKDDNCVLKDLPSAISHIDRGPSSESSDPWFEDTGDWTAGTDNWDYALFNPHEFMMVGSNPTEVKLQRLEDPAIVQDDWYVERKGLAVVGQDRVSGSLKADNNVMKLLDRIWLKARGGAFNVELGCQEFSDSPNTYDTAQVFTPGADKYKDFFPQNGRFLSLKISKKSDEITATEIDGFNLEIELLGEQ